MKNTLTIMLSGSLLCACSQKQATSVRPATDLVEAGKDITSFGGCVIHVTKRDGTSLEGVKITTTGADGQKTTVTADTGTLSPGSFEDATDNNSVKLILHNAHSETLTAAGKQVTDSEERTLILNRRL